MTTKFFPRLVRMEKNTRKPFRVGNARVWVDREEDGTFTVTRKDDVTRFSLAGSVAVYLNTLRRN